MDFYLWFIKDDLTLRDFKSNRVLLLYLDYSDIQNDPFTLTELDFLKIDVNLALYGLEAVLMVFLLVACQSN